MEGVWMELFPMERARLPEIAAMQVESESWLGHKVDLEHVTFVFPVRFLSGMLTNVTRVRFERIPDQPQDPLRDALVHADGSIIERIIVR